MTERCVRLNVTVGFWSVFKFFASCRRYMYSRSTCNTETNWLFICVKIRPNLYLLQKTMLVLTPSITTQWSGRLDVIEDYTFYRTHLLGSLMEMENFPKEGHIPVSQPGATTDQLCSLAFVCVAWKTWDWIPVDSCQRVWYWNLLPSCLVGLCA